MTRNSILISTFVCGFLAMCCVVSLTTRDHELGPVPVAAQNEHDSPLVVEGRKRRTPEQQAAIDHRREERAKRWGIFLHYLGMGASPLATGGSWLTWPFRLAWSLFSFAWTVGTDLLLLIGIVLVGGMAAFVVCGVMVCRWLFKGRKAVA